MHRPRFAVTWLAVPLVAGACGGGDPEPAEGQAEAVSTIEGADTLSDAGDPASRGLRP